ncbi:MAG: NAD(P)/FAD-dependent oxidoreductase [Bacteroidetes bacterium]|nr:NAD(P)/FAD-dependent oxidoreductase [Bacteroidota bacterium]
MVVNETVIIIGGGPAGAACAVQLKRYGIDVLLIEKDSIGGLLNSAWRLDNYPGYPEGIRGVDMAGKIEQHLKKLEVRYQKSEVRSLKFANGVFVLKTENNNFTSQYLVLATGTNGREIFPGLNPEVRRKVFYEVFPLRGMKGKKIAIIGAGDAAFDYAMSLAEHNQVDIFNRSSVIKCIPALHDISKTQQHICYHENMELIAIDEDGGGVRLKFSGHQEPAGYSADYIIFATGREPNLSLLSPDLIKVLDKLEPEGVLYRAGDVKNGMLRQASVAIGDGIKVAMAIKDRIL